MNQEEKPVIFQGGLFRDNRGAVRFANDCALNGVQRFYIVENAQNQPIRAFQCHLKEAKYVYVLSGKAQLVVVPLDRLPTPNIHAPLSSYVLDATNPQVLYIPAGYANGFQSLREHTQLLFFSTCSVEASKADDMRLPFDYWGTDIWKQHNAN